MAASFTAESKDKMKKTIIILLFSIALISCKENSAKNIYKAPIGDIYICLDKKYHSWGDDPNDSGIFITLLRPDMRPISRSDTRKSDAEYWKNKTNISLKLAKGGLPEKTIESRLKEYLPTNETKYGLSVTKDISKSQSHALYLEPGYKISDSKAGYFRCMTYSAPNPQCRHHFEHEKFSYVVTYSNKNLENWKHIKQQVIQFIESNTCE
jgi:hypothetical protein